MLAMDLGRPLMANLRPSLVSALPNGRSKRVDEAGPDRLGLSQFLLNLGVLLGLPVAQAQILQLTLDGVQSPSGAPSGAYMKSVSPAILSCFSRFMLSSVRMLCSRSAILIRMTRMSSLSVSKHLPKVLRLGALGGIENARNLGQPVDDGPLPLAEHALDVVQRNPCILHGVVKQGAHDARRIQADFFGTNPRYRYGMEDIGLTRPSAHVLVRFYRQLPGLPNPLAVLLALCSGQPHATAAGIHELTLVFQYQVRRKSYALPSSGIQGD